MSNRPISRTEICQRVRGILGLRFNLEPHEIRSTTTVGAICGNVIDFVEMLGALREAFDVSFQSSAFSDNTTVGELIDWIEGGVNS